MPPSSRERSFGSLSTSRGIMPLPCMMIRGGTSRGAFFRAGDLPGDKVTRDQVLLSALGSPHPLQIDGIGGGNPLTSKVAIVGPSADPGADVDYLFAQIGIEQPVVDTRAACGNILAGVGPFAVETGLVAARSPTTVVRIRNVNTDTIALATLDTPDGLLRYDGDQTIAGLATPAAPVRLSFVDAGGAMTGYLLPTGRTVEEIDGIPVSLVDYSIPVMIVEASRLGLTGEESPAEIDADRDLLDRIEQMRLVAGQRIGLGDVSRSVAPKVALVSPPGHSGTINSRYLMPWRCHRSHAVTGALCPAVATRIDGSVAAAFTNGSHDTGFGGGSRASGRHPSGGVRGPRGGVRYLGSEDRTPLVQRPRLSPGKDLPCCAGPGAG